MKTRVFLIFLLLTLSSIQARASIDDFIGEDFTFKIKETADYTNHLVDTMLISVEGNKEIAYTFLDSGGDGSYHHWITGVLQVDVENEVNMGHLNYSGFDAEEGGRKSASVSSVNMTLSDPANYSTNIELVPMAFLTSHSTNVTLVDNSTIPTVFVGLDQPYFVIDPTQWVDSIETYFINYKSRIESSTELTVTLDKEERNFKYTVEGQMADVHTFTYHDRIQTAADYNTVGISGGFSINYDENGALSEYSADYEISYEEIRILQYSYTISTGSGAIGNIQVGDAGLFPAFDLFLALLSLFILLPVIRLVRRRN